ncbi:hypothetical protein EON65_15005 [archaeon]|nr:MAG: hypothetical protein EON65_15005 [archaeon]
MDGTSFVYIRHKNLFLVAATKGNPNTFLMFEYLLQMKRIFQAYLGEDFTDESLQVIMTIQTMVK